ncbi:hypothetical protein F4775DRAFT_563010 [Biscogniauxia sp. FL1348]|nr:hypothetical protein F4775DRAFT_563010 [Biscogniauxia sp. FL1348]
MFSQAATARVSSDEWARHRDTILDLYVGEDLTLQILAGRMENDHGFRASISQYEAQLKRWGARKNLKTHEWKPILDRIDRIPRGINSRVVICGRVMPSRRLRRARRHCKANCGRATDPSLRGVSSNNQRPSNTTEQVHIETQDIDGKWVRLEDSHPPSPVAEQASRSSVSEVTQFPELEDQVVFNSSIFGSPPFDITMPLSDFQFVRPLSPIRLNKLEVPQYSIALRALFDRPAQVPIMYMGTSPSVWLNGLPSSSIQDCLCDSEYMPKPVARDLTKALYSSRMLSDIFSSSSLMERLQRLISLLPGRDLQQERGQRQTLISMGEILETNFIRLLVVSLINEFTCLDDIPMEDLVKILGQSNFINTILSNLLSASSKHSVKSWGENILRAAIKAKESRTVTRILAMEIVDINDTTFNEEQGKLTPVELAATLGDLETMKALIQSGADINKSYNDYICGALEWVLSYLMTQEEVGPEHISFAEKLPDLGAIVRPTAIERFYNQRLGSNLCYILASHIPVSQHRDFFKQLRIIPLCLRLGDKEATRIIEGMLSDCATTHHSRCIYQSQQSINSLLYGACFEGHYNLVQLLLPYIDSMSTTFGSSVLSAAIYSGNNDLIGTIMAQRPNINPPVFRKPEELGLHDLRGLGVDFKFTTPLAEAIRAKNQFLITTFEQAGALEALYEGQRFGVAVAAAAEIADLNLVTKLLGFCEDHKSRHVSDGLLHAIQTNDEMLFTLLLEKGSLDGISAFENMTLLAEAVAQRNRNMVHALLKAGIIQYRDAHLYPTLERALEWGDRPIIDALLTAFEYSYPSSVLQYQYWKTDSDGVLHSYDPEYSPRLYWKGRRKVLRNILGNAAMVEFIVNSRLASQQFLTDLLIVAVYYEDYGMAKYLVSSGANTFDVCFLNIAADCHPSMLRLLTEDLKGRKGVAMNGEKTAFLKAVISGEPTNPGSTRTLINSGILTKFDFSDSGKYYVPLTTRTTPLGEALALGKRYPEVSCDITLQLLDAGCDSNSIVEWATGPETFLVSKTALLKAIETENKETTQLLIQRGARIDGEIQYGVRQTPLQKAAETGNLEIVRLLLERGVNVNEPPCFSYGGTAFQYAAISGNCNVASELLSRGASLYMAPSKVGGRFPLEGAAEHGRIDMIDFLWKVEKECFTLENVETGFQEKHCRKAMRLAVENGHMGCRDLIAQLSGLPITAGDKPPEPSPIYIDWPPPGARVPQD